MTDYPGPPSSSYQPGPHQSAPGQLGPDQPGGSTTAVARDQAAAVGQTASEAGSRVTQTAADQASRVASEAARHARDLVGEAGGQVRDQTSVQQQKAASQLHSVADEMREMADKGGQSGLATEVAHQAAERLHGVGLKANGAMATPGFVVEPVPQADCPGARRGRRSSAPVRCGDGVDRRG